MSEDNRQGDMSLDAYTDRYALGTTVRPLREGRPRSVDLSGVNRSAFRVLIVEDDPATQMLLRVLLAEHCEITLIPTGAKALSAATHGDPASPPPAFDMVIVDIGLDSPLSGVELISQFQAQRVFQDTPIVALTAHALSEDRKRFLNNTLSTYRRKLFTPSELFSLVMEMID